MLPLFKSRIVIPRSTIKYHIIFWAFYVLFEGIMTYTFNYFLKVRVNVLMISITYFLIVTFFYLSLFYVIPHIIFKPRNVLKFILSLVFYASIYILLDFLRKGNYILRSKGTTHPVLFDILATIYGYVNYLIFAAGYAYAYMYLQKEKENSKIVKQKVEAETERNKVETKLLSTQNDLLKSQNDLFKSQINPHLLFNVLNSLKAQAIENNPELPDNIQRVADIMRYSISSTSNQTSLVDIADEIAQMNNLVEIQKMRFETCSININCKGNIRRGNFITPLSFIVALENAFKHGETRNKVHPIEVIVDVSNPDQIYFSCVNKIRKGSIEISHGIGIENTKNRLKQNFGENFILNTFSEGDFYHYDLIIKRKPVTS
jgi:two-component system, LytTR family, sensor kinase